jgi:DNA-binding GntR family transcriptional regulator
MIKLTEREVQDLYDVRAALESLSIATAALYIRSEDIRELKRIQDTGEEYFNSDQFAAYRNYDRAFHDRILSISGNSLLIDFMKRIRTRITLCISSTVRIPELHEQGVKQHRGMIDLLERKDAKGAEELMKNHVQIAKQAFLRNYRTQER